MGESTGGIHSKFQERLRNIRLSRIRKKKMNEKFILEKVQKIREVVGKESPDNRSRYIPRGIGEVERDRQEKDIVQLDKIQDEKEYSIPIQKDSSNYSGDKSYLVEEKEVVHTPKYPYISKNKKIVIKKQGLGIIDREKVQEKFELEILDKLKICFEEKKDELEVLESELYLLNQKQKEEVELEKVRELKQQIEEIVCKIRSMMDEYHLYSKSYYIDRILEVSDKGLEDDFIRYKDLVDSYVGEKKFVQDYKRLEEFQELYAKLIEVRGDTQCILDENEEKIRDFDIRDKKYDAIRVGMVDIEKANRQCFYEIEKQNEYFASLMKNIGHIDYEKYTTYHLMGIGELLHQSLRYIGLKMASPFRGMIPSIAVNTIVTRRMIRNVYRNMHTKKQEHIRYKAIDYDNELSWKIMDIDSTSLLLEDTFRDLKRLKEDFLMQYDSKIPGYEDTLKKIGQFEENIIRNQHMVEIIRKNLKASKKINEEKLIKVKELNELH